MKQSLHVEKTKTVTVNGNQYLVERLPQEIIYEIETLDRYSQDFRTAFSELEKAQILVNTKKAHVEQLLTELFKKEGTDQEAE